MSYLKLPNGIPDFSKAVFSLWFRVPQESLQKAAADAADSASTRPRLRGIVPLLVFGEMFEGYSTEAVLGPSSSYTKSFYIFDSNRGYIHLRDESHQYTIGPNLVKTTTHLEDPSYIGIACSSDEDAGTITASLQIRLQGSEIGLGSLVSAMPREFISNHAQLVSSFTTSGEAAPATDTAYAYFQNRCLTDAVVPSGTKIETRSYVDESALWAGERGPDSIVVGGAIEVTPDTWHHLLLSFDVSEPVSSVGGTVFDAYPCGPDPARTMHLENKITNPCKMWIALDDENHTGNHLADPRFGGADREAMGLGDNDVAPYNNIQTTFINNGGMSSKIWEVSGLVAERNWPVAGMPTYQSASGMLPSSGHPLGIPCTPELVDCIYRVEMAELQIFTNVTLNTGNALARRAFVKNGKPVDPVGTDKDPAPAVKLLGKKPEVLLHGNSNWQKGFNTGTLGFELDEEGNLKPKTSGQFTPVAGIEKFKPEPELKETETA